MVPSFYLLPAWLCTFLLQSKQVMRPVKRCLMELNPSDEEGGNHTRYKKAVMEIGEHIASSMTQWASSEERTQWKK